MAQKRLNLKAKVFEHLQENAKKKEQEIGFKRADVNKKWGVVAPH